MADRAAHALFLLSTEHAAVLMSLHPGNASRAKQLVAEVQPELAHAVRGLPYYEASASDAENGPVAQVVRAHA